MSSIEPHNEFLELCAVSTSGQLTGEEWKRLQEHLAVCQSCPQALKQYETVVNQAIPAIAASKEVDEVEEDPSWSQLQAEKDLFKRLVQEERDESLKFPAAIHIATKHSRPPVLSNESAWHHVWMLYAAAILLFASLTFYAYWAGVHRGTDTARQMSPQRMVQSEGSPEAQLSDAGHERQAAHVLISQRDKTISDLRQQLAQQSTEIIGLKQAKDHLANDLRAGGVTRQDLIQQSAGLTEKLDAIQASSVALQQKLDSAKQQSVQDSARAQTLDAKVNDLTRLLHDREAALDQKDELLAHDRDIRELMGARDLYVAEVYDVARNGETQKPYGRVFYTKGMSLIFYAYDLDVQAELKHASTFQAWGRRGPDRQQALNLGVFYEDSASKKRWMLKCDDPKTLEQIDAVFVTVEPNGGSHKPSGKSLLFAYLRVDPNHP